MSAKFFFFNISFFVKNDFCSITPYLLNTISKLHCNSSLEMNMAIIAHTIFFSDMTLETEEHIK